MSGMGAIYFNHGTKHCARMATSIFSLIDKKPPLEIAILDTGESSGIAEQIAEAARADYVRIPLIKKRRHSCYVTKASLWRYSPFEETLFLDSDTIICHSPWAVLEGLTISKENFLVTGFADWVTTGPIYRKRLEQWRGVKCEGVDVDLLLSKCLSSPRPAINTGVMAWHRKPGESVEILEEWERLATAGWKCSFTDEYAMQLLLEKHPHCLAADCWNCSPLYGLHKSTAGIWHCHGSKHVQRPNGRGEQGHALWWPVFQEAWKANFASIRDWAPAGDKWLGLALERFSQAS